MIVTEGLVENLIPTGNAFMSSLVLISG